MQDVSVDGKHEQKGNTMKGLCIHCGANRADREEVSAVRTPPATTTWFPIPHITLINRVQEALTALNLRIVEEAHAITHDGMRYFGLLRVENCKPTGDDFGYVLGLRNAHDQSFKASLAVGSNVFVCDNLSFSGEITIARKHTRHIERDLPLLTGNAIGLLSQRWTVMEDRYNAYKGTELTDAQAHDAIIRALDVEASTTRQLDTVLKEWRTPRHPEFAEHRNVWRLFNAFTEAAKESSLQMLPQRTIRLHGLMDTYANFKVPTLEVTSGTTEADAATVQVQNN